MKYLITNNQLNLLMESTDDKILMFPDPDRLGGWDILQQLLEKRGNPRYGIRGDLDLKYSNIKSLGNLKYIGGFLNLFYSSIKSLGNLERVEGELVLTHSKLKTLGNLEYVGSNLFLHYCELKSLGNLKYIGGSLYLHKCPLELTTEEEIRSKVNVVGDIYFK